MTEPVGVGVIGAGYWGRKLIGEYLSAEHRGSVKLLKVCDASIGALGALLISKGTSSIPQNLLTQNVEEILEDQQISAVHIATPNQTHYTLAKKALETGKNVLVEKPMTLKSSEAYELVDYASSENLVIQVGHIFRFNSALQAAREVLGGHQLGNVFYARIQWTDYQAPFDDRDIIFDLGPHPVDILNQLFGSWPTQVTGMTRGYRGSKERGEVAYVLAEMPNGAFAHIELSWLHPGKVREVTIVGSGGTLVVDCLNQRVFRYSGEKIGERFEKPVATNNTIASEINHFIESVRHGDMPLEVSLVGPRTVEVLETIRASLSEPHTPVIKPAGYDRWIQMIDQLENAANQVSNIP